MLPHKDYFLYQDNILEKIKSDETAFKNCMTGNFHVIARQFGYDINISRNRLGEVWIHWLDDLGRIKDERVPTETIELDHFKHAAFLCFWLRRLIPLGFMFLSPTPINGVGAIDPEQEWFAQYGNEICATRIGIMLCHGYEIKKIQKAIGQASTENVAELTGRRARLIEMQPMSSRLEIDMVTNLKHKNNSPHSINLIFRALFSEYDVSDG